MKLIALVTLLSLSACSKVVTESGAGDGGSDGGSGGASIGPSDGGAGGSAVDCSDKSPLMGTCQDDCQCDEGQRCVVCVNTISKDCIDYCKPGDIKCNYGVVTCPIDTGLECAGVMLCQEVT